MGIYCDHHSRGGFDVGIDDVVTEPNDILTALPTETALLRIPEQTWYPRLNTRTQLLIRVGTTLAEKTYLATEKVELEDFSPLLLSFAKAAECELADHYQTHATSLITIAEIIESDIRLPSNGNRIRNTELRDLRGLLETVSKLTTFRFDYYPSGILPLYYFLKFFALRTGLTHLSFRSYLDETKISPLSTMQNGLTWLKSLGHNRNDFIHERLIDNEHEFLMYYDGICRVLKLLVELKNDDGINST